MDSSISHPYNVARRVIWHQIHQMAEERVQRRLAAILVADVAGYRADAAPAWFVHGIFE